VDQVRRKELLDAFPQCLGDILALQVKLRVLEIDLWRLRQRPTVSELRASSGARSPSGAGGGARGVSRARAVSLASSGAVPSSPSLPMYPSSSAASMMTPATAGAFVDIRWFRICSNVPLLSSAHYRHDETLVKLRHLQTKLLHLEILKNKLDDRVVQIARKTTGLGVPRLQLGADALRIENRIVQLCTDASRSDECLAIPCSRTMTAPGVLIRPHLPDQLQ
jgi:hypothetical protein